MTGLLRRAVRGATVLGLVCGGLVAAALPAAAMFTWGVKSPREQALVSGPLDVVAFADALQGEQVQEVTVRFLHDGRLSGDGNLRYRSGPRSDGRSEWGATLNPLASWMLGGQAMANGRYEVQARVTFVLGVREQTTGWRGHAITLRVPPPATAVTARGGGGGTVEVTWRQVRLPDFIRYDVERSANGANWGRVTSTSSAEATRIVDTPPPGTWRYRTRVVRSDGRGGELSTASGAAVIHQPVRPPPAAPPQPAPGNPAPQPAPGKPAAQPAPGKPGPPPVGRAVQPLNSANLPPLAPPAPPPPAVAPDKFEETLPYPEIAEPGSDLEDEREPGRMLAVRRSRLGNRGLLSAMVTGLVLMAAAGLVGWQLRRR